MALNPDGDLETASFVLTKEQVRRLRALRDLRHSTHRRVTLSDIAREVVEEGLSVISSERNIVSTASLEVERVG